MAGKKKKRYSMRGKMITVNMGIMLGALLLCGSIFVFSVFFIISDYIHHDMDFFLTATADGMESGLSYLEKVIYALRDSETVMGYMEKSRNGRLTEEECRTLEAAFSRAVDISSPENLGNVQMPVALEISLVDPQGDFVSTGYYAMPTSEKETGARVFREVFRAFEKESAESGVGYFYQEREDGLFLAFPLYDGLMDRAGTVLFKLNKEALEKRMEELTASYPGAFWALCDRTGKSLDGGNQEAFWNTAGAERETFEEYRYEPFRMETGGRDYRAYRKLLPMDLQVFLGIPENHAMMLMYSSVRIYVLLIAVSMITCTGSSCSFTYLTSAIPSAPGMRISVTRISGASSSICSSTSLPLDATKTTSQPRRFQSISVCRAFLTIGSSSASITLYMAFSLSGFYPLSFFCRSSSGFSGSP